MKLIERIVDGFILTVGITPPTPRTRTLATTFIALGIALSLLAVLAFFVFLLMHPAGR